MKKPIIRILLSVLLVAVVAVGGTLAYLMASDSPLLNTFKLANVETEIEEPSSGTAAEKKASVKNTGESPVYVRARVVVSGLEEDQLTVLYTDKWKFNSDDGFYYYTDILASEEETPLLFDGVMVSKEVPETAQFSVDVYQESVLAPADGAWTIEAAKAAFDAKG